MGLVKELYVPHVHTGKDIELMHYLCPTDIVSLLRRSRAIGCGYDWIGKGFERLRGLSSRQGGCPERRRDRRISVVSGQRIR